MSIWQSHSLCEEEIEELRKATIFQIEEIEVLFERFKYLDKTSSGFLTFVDFQMIPEFYSNPFCNLIINYLEGLNGYEKVTFANYLDFLCIFNVKTQTYRRISFLFNLFDLKKIKRIRKEDLLKIQSIILTIEHTNDTTDDTSSDDISDADYILNEFDEEKKGYLNFNDFENFYNSDPNFEKNMIIDISRYTNKMKEVRLIDLIWPSK
jgi:Ca2+-binding EF-hand superfamily protein